MEEPSDHSRKLRRTAEKTASATVRLVRSFPVRTITNDRGHEFGHHKRVAHQLNTKVFFCHPYFSQERGTNENRIGVIRQYFSKRSRLLDLTWNLNEEGGKRDKQPSYEVFGGHLRRL